MLTVLFQDKVISTPAIKGTILPGITRKSIIDVARTQGYEVFSLMQRFFCRRSILPYSPDIASESHGF